MCPSFCPSVSVLSAYAPLFVDVSVFLSVCLCLFLSVSVFSAYAKLNIINKILLQLLSLLSDVSHVVKLCLDLQPLRWETHATWSIRRIATALFVALVQMRTFSSTSFSVRYGQV